MTQSKADEAIFTCQSIELSIGDILGSLTNAPDLLDIPAYKELAEHMCLAARKAATVSRIMGDEKTAKYIDSTVDKIIHIMED